MTDKKTEALKLAFEALDQYIEKELTVGQRYTNEGQQLLDAHAILRQALAHPEQSQTSGYAKKIESLIKERDELRQALEQSEQEPTVPDNMQDWANLDGDIAWHLIERHADNWADIKKMMDEFVSAKIASAQSKHECETCANKRKRLEQSGFLKSPLRGEE